MALQIGSVVFGPVTYRMPFGVFLDIQADRKALLEFLFLFEEIPEGKGIEGMPPLGTNINAIIIAVLSDEYRLSALKKDFAKFGKGDRWKEWRQN